MTEDRITKEHRYMKVYFQSIARNISIEGEIDDSSINVSKLQEYAFQLRIIQSYVTNLIQNGIIEKE